MADNQPRRHIKKLFSFDAIAAFSHNTTRKGKINVFIRAILTIFSFGEKLIVLFNEAKRLLAEN